MSFLSGTGTFGIRRGEGGLVSRYSPAGLDPAAIMTELTRCDVRTDAQREQDAASAAILRTARSVHNGGPRQTSSFTDGGGRRRIRRPARRYGYSNGNRRGNTKDRHRRKVWLLSEFGDGTTVTCSTCPTMVDIRTLFVDLWPVQAVDGGRYVRGNIRPQCGPCSSAQGLAMARATLAARVTAGN